MARKEEQKTNNGSGHIKVRVIEFEIDGHDATLAEGIKAFTTALSHSAVIVTTPKRPALPVPERPNTPVALDAEEPEPADTSTDGLEQEVAEEKSSNGQKRSYNYRPPKFMDDLDLTKGTKPLAEFIAEKGSPTEMLDRYLVVAVWLKKHLQIEEFTINHIYTAFDNLGWKAQMPPNHSQPLRDLKTKKHFLTKEKSGAYKVNWQGTQHVEKMGAIQ
ncbi:MAG: hypothetical protein ACREQN_03485 [Candidatus Binataceae bacterium]